MGSSARSETGVLHGMHLGVGLAVVRASLLVDSRWNAFPADHLVSARLEAECWTFGEAGVAKARRWGRHLGGSLVAAHAQPGGDALVTPGGWSEAAAGAHFLPSVLGVLPQLASTWGAFRQSPAGHQGPTMNGLPRGCRVSEEAPDGPDGAFRGSGRVSMDAGRSGRKDCEGAG